MGILTGKFTRKTQFPDGDFRQSWVTDSDRYEQYLEDLALVEKLRPIAGSRSLAVLALQFAAANPIVSTVIPGLRTPEQVQENIKAAGIPAFTVSDLREIDKIVPPCSGRKIWPA